MAAYGVRVSSHPAPGTPAALIPQSADPAPELASALEALGPHRERALRLLRDAAMVLADPGRWHAPYEVAQSCCRGALDAVVHIVGDDFPGPQSAQRKVTAAAAAVTHAWRAQQSSGSDPGILLADAEHIAALLPQLEALASAVDGMELQQPGRRDGRIADPVGCGLGRA